MLSCSQVAHQEAGAKEAAQLESDDLWAAWSLK